MLGDKRGEQCEDARVGTGRKAEVDLLEGDRGDGDSPALANPRQHVSAGTATRQLRQNVGVEQIHQAEGGMNWEGRLRLFGALKAGAVRPDARLSSARASATVFFSPALFHFRR